MLGIRALSETQAAAVAPDDWRTITLKSLIRDGKAAEFLTREYDLTTVGDLHDMERDGDPLNDLGVDSKTREAIRAAVLKLRADRGWGPDEGYPAAWLEPAQPEPESDLSLWYVRPKGKQTAIYAIQASDRDQAEAYVRSQHPTDAKIEILDAGQAKAANLLIPLDLWVRKIDPAEPIDVCHRAPDPDRDLEAALRKALECDEPRRAAEWTELVAHGATDPDLRAKIVAAFGTGDVICGHAETGPCTGVTWSARGGARPAFWLGWHRGHDAGPAPNPTIQGPALVARVRRLLAIPTPRDVAVVARGQKALRRQVRAEGCKAAAALEATP